MRKNKLHYIGYCVASDEAKNYVCNVASGLKMHYIADVALRSGFDVSILSMCATVKRFSKICINKSEKTPITHIASMGGKDIVSKVINKFLFFIQLAIYVLFFVNKNDTILLYHSVKLSKYCLLLNKIKKLNIVLEVEEIYAYSAEGVKSYENEELECIKRFDQYIFVNGYIPQYLNIPKEKYIVIYGSYKPEITNNKKFLDGKIHVVYAGAIETLNKGAFTAIQTARYLPDNFIVHILGKGTDENIKKACSDIAAINENKQQEMVVYEGFMSGQELDEFLCSCDIGLGAYQIKEKYSDFVFPSKLVSYMCHDLQVVTGKSKCYEQAPIAENWVFYSENTYEAIAKALVEASERKKASSIELIKELDEKTVCAFSFLYKHGVWENSNEK